MALSDYAYIFLLQYALHRCILTYQLTDLKNIQYFTFSLQCTSHGQKCLRRQTLKVNLEICNFFQFLPAAKAIVKLHSTNIAYASWLAALLIKFHTCCSYLFLLIALRAQFYCKYCVTFTCHKLYFSNAMIYYLSFSMTFYNF